MFRSTRPEKHGAAGFTLIEALAALAVMGAGLAAIGSLTSSNSRVGLYTEQHLAGIEATRKIITGMPGRDALPFGRLTGALDSYGWRVESTPLAMSPRADDAGWAPQSIALSVRLPSGATVTVDMVRLRKLSSK